MRKYAVTLFVFLLIFSNASAWVGEGTKANPYLISTPEDLIALSDKLYYVDKCEGVYFQQTQDIDMRGVTDFRAIGSQYYPFKGFYDGKEHRIYNLVVAKGGFENSCVALFGGVENGTIENVHIEGASCFRGYSHVASIVGYLYNGAVIDCRSSALVIATSDYSNNIGGLVGTAVSSKIKESHNTGLVIANGKSADDIGGIVGEIAGTSVTDCYNKGTVIGTKNVGGICGYVPSTEVITECYNWGVVTGSEYVGGIAGYVNTGLLSTGAVTVCYNAGKITAESYAGGIAGYSAHAGLCGNLGSVTATNYAGGIAGRGYVYSSYNNGIISGEDGIGGIAGSVLGIEGCYNNGHVSGKYVVGGLGGAMMGTENWMKNSYNVGVVAGGTYRGGLIGHVKTDGFVNANKILNCYYNSDLHSGKGVSNLTDPTPFDYSDRYQYWGLTSLEMKGAFYTTLAVGWVFNDDDGYPLIEGMASVSLSVAAPVYTITSDVGSNGSISIPQTLEATKDASIPISIVPDEGYEVDRVIIDGKVVTPVNNVYNLDEVSGNHAVQVTFRVKSSSVNAVKEQLNSFYVNERQICGNAQGIIRIYTIAGLMIDSFESTGNFRSEQLTAGMYVVQTECGFQKVLIP